MKIEKITENKIRIFLNLDDLKNKNIDLHAFMSNSIESQSLFVDMLDEAEKKVGFYAKDSKVLIEAIASSEGLFIFTITKVEDDLPKRKTIRVKRRIATNNYKKAIYQFESFDEFCEFCTYINDGRFKEIDNFSKNTSLYLYKDNYYLVFSDINIQFVHLNEIYAYISEFAKYISYKGTFESKLLEYGKPIMKRNALKRCIEYFG